MRRKHLNLRTLYENHLVFFRFLQGVSGSLSCARCQSPCSDARAPKSISAVAQLTPVPFSKDGSSRGSARKGGVNKQASGGVGVIAGGWGGIS